MPELAAVLLLTIVLPGGPLHFTEQRMPSLHDCLELAEAWLNQSGEAPLLRHGAKLSARCSVELPPSINN
jgi:hypothetical protein